MNELYEDGEHYDRVYPGTPHPVWKEQAETYGGPLLELGCGTGRITLALAEQGLDVTGIDNAPAMLARARQKADNGRLTASLVEGDITDFALDRQFGTIIFPATTLCHILTREAFEGLARSIRLHLKADGALIIDVFVPNPLILIRDPEGRYPFGHYQSEKGPTWITCNNTYDSATQINHITTYTQTGEADHTESRLDMRMYYPQELEAPLAYNGLPIVERYGTLDKGPSPLNPSAS